MFNFSKAEQMPSHQETVNNNESESVLSAKREMDKAFDRFKQPNQQV